MQAFRQRVRETVTRDLEREDAEAEALRLDVVDKLRAAIAAERERGECAEAWLFGSFAWGRPVERSDVDVLVKGCRRRNVELLTRAVQSTGPTLLALIETLAPVTR